MLNEVKDERYHFYELCKKNNAHGFFDLYFPYSYSDEKYISILSIESRYAGGNRTWHLPKAYNFDIVTGRFVEIHDVFDGQEADILDRIFSLLETFLQDQDGWHEHFFHLFREEIIKNKYDTRNFFLGNETLTIFYPMGEIAPYGTGILYFEIQRNLLDF